MNLPSASFQPLFSKKDDLIIFIAPVALAAFCVLSMGYWADHSSSTLQTDLIKLWFLRIYFTLIGYPHIYATFHKLKIDRDLAPQKNAYLWEVRAFWLITACAGVAYYFGGRYASLIIYADIFHHVRQQQGWLSLSQKRQTQLSRGEKILDNIMIYNVSVAPLLWWHANPTLFGWFGEGDLIFFLPEWFGAAIIALHWAICCVYIGIYFFWYLKGRPFNTAKFLVILNTWVVFYIGILFLRDGMKNLLILFNHALPYLFLVFRYFSRYRTPNSPGFLDSNLFRFYGPLVGVALLINPFIASPWMMAWGSAFAVFGVWLTAFHIFFDAFIWRVRKKESTLKEFFGFTPPQSLPSSP